jgi:hypothetical protein
LKVAPEIPDSSIGVVALEWYHPTANPGQLKIRERAGHAPISLGIT